MIYLLVIFSFHPIVCDSNRIFHKHVAGHELNHVRPSMPN
jgi:hypothetical protein